MPNLPEPLPAAVLRRLAEAADGCRTGEQVWFFVDLNDLGVVYAADGSNLADMRTLHSARTEFGPFLTPADPNAGPDITGVEVFYSDSTSEYIDCQGIDALFFTRAAREKFKYPYYARTLGPAAAAALQAADLAAETASPPLAATARGWTHQGVSDP